MITRKNGLIGPENIADDIIEFILEQVADELADQTMKERVHDHVDNWTEEDWRRAAVQAEFDIEAGDWNKGKPSYDDLKGSLKRALSRNGFPNNAATLDENEYYIEWKD
jgi:hypothetical protein